MADKINILSTKKLTETQKQELENAGFSVTDEDFIEVESKDFEWINGYDFLIFTSQNAVKSVLLHKDIAQIKTKKCFCVGEKTKELLEQNGFEVIHFSEYAAELATVICNQYEKNSFTFFCGNLRRETLPEAMKNSRIPFSEICVYETKLTPKKISEPINGILFFSPSGVESYLKENKIDNKICFCIGTTTAETLQNKTENIVIASQPKVENVITETLKYYNR